MLGSGFIFRQTNRRQAFLQSCIILLCQVSLRTNYRYSHQDLLKNNSLNPQGRVMVLQRTSFMPCSSFIFMPCICRLSVRDQLQKHATIMYHFLSELIPKLCFINLSHKRSFIFCPVTADLLRYG